MTRVALYLERKGITSSIIRIVASFHFGASQNQVLAEIIRACTWPGGHRCHVTPYESNGFPC